MIPARGIRTTVPFLIVTASWLTDSKMTGGLVSTGDQNIHALSREVGSFSDVPVGLSPTGKSPIRK